MIKNKWVTATLFVILVIVCWNILEVLYTSMITHSSYQFRVRNEFFYPFGLGIIGAYLFFLRGRE